jgi:hypothetical protein
MAIVEKLVEWRLAGEPKYSEKTYPSTTLSTTNPTWLDPGLNPGRRGGKPAANRLSYGAAFPKRLSNILFLKPYESGTKTDLHKTIIGVLHLSRNMFSRILSNLDVEN